MLHHHHHHHHHSDKEGQEEQHHLLLHSSSSSSSKTDYKSIQTNDCQHQEEEEEETQLYHHHDDDTTFDNARTITTIETKEFFHVSKSFSLFWIVIIPLILSCIFFTMTEKENPNNHSSSFERRFLHWTSPSEERIWQMFWGKDNYILDKLTRETITTQKEEETTSTTIHSIGTTKNGTVPKNHSKHRTLSFLSLSNDDTDKNNGNNNNNNDNHKSSLNNDNNDPTNPSKEHPQNDNDNNDNNKNKKSRKNDPKLVLGGKLVLNANNEKESFPANIAQYDLIDHEWDTDDVVLLSLYNSYASGEVYSILANHSDQTYYYNSMNPKYSPSLSPNYTPTITTLQSPNIHTNQKIHANDTPATASAQTNHLPLKTTPSNTDKDERRNNDQSDKTHHHRTLANTRSQVIVVGAFDTTSGASQVTYCSLAAWDGYRIDKVGEGLCNSAYLPRGMKITCAAMAGSQEIYVAGSFATQVWMDDLHKFVNIFNIAHYDASKQVWTPLPVGHLTCSWCIVTVLALAWDSKRRQLHVAGKFNGIDGLNIPSGLAIFDADTGHLVAHPGGGLTMANVTQDGVGTALQLDEEADVLYVMGSFERIGHNQEIFCAGMAAYEISTHKWTCLADSKHAVLPSGGGNMLLTPYGLMVAGKTSSKSLTTWPNPTRPYTIALLKATLKKSSTTATTSSPIESKNHSEDDTSTHDFTWSWLPGFDGHEEPIHALANGVGDFEGTVFIGGDNLVAMYYYDSVITTDSNEDKTEKRVPVTRDLSLGRLRGQVMAIAQLQPSENMNDDDSSDGYNNGQLFSMTRPFIIALYFLALGALMGVFLAMLCNRGFPNLGLTGDQNRQANITFSKVGGGISLDMLTYSAVENTGIADAYQRAMRTRFVEHAQVLSLIDPQEIILHRIIGEGRFGRVWSAKWRSSRVAVKEFVFAQAAVKKAASLSTTSSSLSPSSQSNVFIEEIIGEAGMMAMLRHPNVLQLFGCSLTAQAIWIVSELMSLGSLRQLLDDPDRELPLSLRLRLALQVAEGMMYLHEQNPPIIHRDLKSHNIFVHETLLMEEDVMLPSSPSINKHSQASSNNENDNNGSNSNSYNKNGDSNSQHRAKKLYSSESTNNNDKSNSDSSMVPPKTIITTITADHNTQSTSLFIPETTMEDTTMIAKIGDWGSARATLSGSRTMTHSIGTACWLAPEVIQHARSSKKSDVYAYGIILWELATREEVYAGLESTQIIARVANDNLRPHPIPESSYCPWKDVMEQCWHEDPAKRLEFTEIVTALSNILENITMSKEQQ